DCLPDIGLLAARDDDALALICQRVADRGQLGIEELRFVDPHHFRVGRDLLEQVARAADVLRFNAHGAVRGDVVFAVAVVDAGLEDLHLAFRDLRTPQPANELFALAAEHAARDYLDPAAARPVLNVHY